MYYDKYMKITFLGTRGEIEPKTKRHAMHTSTLFSYLGNHLLIDCGYSWQKKVFSIKPQPHHLLLTHAHPDHAWGLKEGSPCPVWATKETWQLIDTYPIPKEERHLVIPRKKQRIGKFWVEPFKVLHSLRCPAVGYRITAGRKTVFYVPDVAYIEHLDAAFKKIALYIGDGATLFRPMIRKLKGRKEIFGHASIRQQLTWCHKEGVKKMIITHCGSGIVSQEKKALKQIAEMGEEKGVTVQVAFDGMVLEL